MRICLDWKYFRTTEEISHNVSFRYAVTIKVTPNSAIDWIGLPIVKKPRQKSELMTVKYETGAERIISSVLSRL
ncbi:MAG: hypothetical protein HFG41_00550 [Coprococcus sp.]|nr:hypothetical protein [Coprococcus sp.]